MRGDRRPVYRNRRPFRVLVTALLCALLALILLTTALFFGLKRHIAYTDSGELYLDIPWMAEELAEQRAKR